MGNSAETPQKLKTIDEVMEHIKNREILDTPGLYKDFSIIPSNDADVPNAQKKLKNMSFDPLESKAIASFLGLAIGDALGCNTEFLPFDPTRKIITNGFQDLHELKKQGQLIRTVIGIWTDDTSMALCLADSLLMNDMKYIGKDCRYRYLLWLYFGYNNGGRPESIGLGGNISISLNEFVDNQTEEVEMGTRANNGNGSLMRLAPVPIAFHDNEELAMEMAAKSSRSTHNGIEAEECCRLMTLMLLRLYKYKGSNPKEEILGSIGKEFKTDCASVKCLANAQQEGDELYQEQLKQYPNFDKFNKGVEDRNWNWKSKDFTYAPTRLKQNAKYIGSYCMDGFAMALNLCYTSDSFEEVILRAVNQGGDCDTVGAIAGQIAGAMYGIEEKMIELYREMDDWKTKEVYLIAYKLFHKHPIESK
jgi:ADP-ribosyl-[dinitrogen reductase] hydrolase